MNDSIIDKSDFIQCVIHVQLEECRDYIKALPKEEKEDLFDQVNKLRDQDKDLKELNTKREALGNIVNDYRNKESLKTIHNNFIDNYQTAIDLLEIEIKTKFIKWEKTQPLLMAFIELCETAGLLGENSFEYSGSIVSKHFSLDDNKGINRRSFNNHKPDYESNKSNYLADLMTLLQETYEKMTT